LKKNLVSIFCLEDKGDIIAFVDGKVLFWSKGSSIDGARVIWICDGRMYRLVSQPYQALVHDEINPSEVSHRRYGHCYYRALSDLSQIVSRVLELLTNNYDVCKVFALGKNIKKPFPNNDNRSKKTLDLIHYDVCGLTHMKSFGGSLYYVTFIDDFSHKTWIYLLNTKDKVFERFQECWKLDHYWGGESVVKALIKFFSN